MASKWKALSITRWKSNEKWKCWSTLTAERETSKRLKLRAFVSYLNRSRNAHLLFKRRWLLILDPSRIVHESNWEFSDKRLMSFSQFNAQLHPQLDFPLEVCHVWNCESFSFTTHWFQSPFLPWADDIYEDRRAEFVTLQLSWFQMGEQCEYIHVVFK